MTTTTAAPTHKQHAKIVNIEITQGYDDKDRTIDEFIADIQAALVAANIKRATVMSRHYILDGKVCRVDDYDPATQDRKPGTFPPSWAGGPTDAELKINAQRFGAGFTGPVADTPTEPKVRKPRAKKSKAATLEAANDLANAMKESHG